MRGNPIDPKRFARCVVKIPPPVVANTAAVRTAGLYLIDDLGQFMLFLHDHVLGGLVVDGWVKADTYPDGEATRRFLRQWMADRALSVLEGDADEG